MTALQQAGQEETPGQGLTGKLICHFFQGNGIMTTDLENNFSRLNKEFLGRLEKCTTLPSPPVVAMRILELSKDPDVDIAKVADVVSMDPALVTKILRIANSPLYALRRKTENLRQAIMLLGLNGTLTMSLSFSLAASMHNNACQGFNYNLFWRRSLATATCCRRLGIASGSGASEEMFLVGLIQDIGMLALDKLQPDFYSTLGVDQSDHVLLQKKERERLGGDHAVIGAWLMHQWGLPDCIKYALLGSHDLQMVDPESEYMPYARCVMASGLLVDALPLENSDEALIPALKFVNEQLSVEEGTLSEILVALNEDFMESASLFETDLTDYGLSDALIDQAREAMMLRNLHALQQTDHLKQETEELESRTRTLEEKASRDGLTGLYNRTYLDEKIEQEFALAKARDWPLVVMFVDLDHFKRVNDTYGHQAGDQVLQEASSLLTAGTRAEDVVARYGGEEFIVILPGCGEKAARAVTDRLVNAFRDTAHRVSGGEEIIITASIGFALMGEGNFFSDTKAMISAADMAVYEAKDQGRDRFVMYSSIIDKPADKKDKVASSG